MTVTNVDNSSELANSLFTALTSGITLPESPDFTEDKFNHDPDLTSDLYTDFDGPTVAAVTTNDLEGTGAFDVFMSAMDKHLAREYDSNRLTGSQYAEAYVQIANQVIGQAANFVLQKDQAKWSAIAAQLQARIVETQATQALIELERVKFQTSQAEFEANLTAAQYAMTKMQTATEEAKHDDVTTGVAIKEYELDNLLPSTLAMNQIQIDRILPSQAAISEYQNEVLQPLEKDIQELQRDEVIPVQIDIQEFQRDRLQPVELAQQQHILQYRQPAETELIHEQTEVQRANTLDTRRDGLTPVGGVISLQKRNLTSDADIKDYTLANQLPKQVDLVDRQITLTEEQGESERAKTLDTRSDGVTTVVGSVGKQKDLYDQQIDSFIKDAAHKTAKMYLDGWITQKTLDEGLTAPTELTNAEINTVLETVRANNSL